MGIEFKESAYSLSPKSSKPLKAGMVLNLSIGFQNIKNDGASNSDAKNKMYERLA